MRKTIITTTLGLFMATVLFSNVYAITEQQSKLATEGALAALQAGAVLRESTSVIQACSLTLELGMLSGLEKCVLFMKDVRDSMQGVMDRHENRSGSIQNNQGSKEFSKELLSDLIQKIQ